MCQFDLSRLKGTPKPITAYEQKDEGEVSGGLIREGKCIKVATPPYSVDLYEVLCKTLRGRADHDLGGSAFVLR